MLRRGSFHALCVLVGLLLPVVARAANDTWDGNGGAPPNGTWGVGNNWVDNTTPGNSDTAAFNSNDTYTVQFNAAPLAIQGLTVSVGDVTFESNGGPFTLPVNSATGGQDLSVSGAGTSLVLGTTGRPLNLTVGDSLSVQSGGTIEARFGSDIVANNLA